MPLYERKVDGKPVERVRPVPDSENERQLAAKAAADGSTWSVVDETAPDDAKGDRRRGRGTAQVAVSGGATDTTPEG